MIAWVMFLTGLILGWLLAWILQKRMDDSLVGQVSDLHVVRDDFARQCRYRTYPNEKRRPVTRAQANR